MLTVNKRQNKLSAAQSIFTQAGMMQGTTLVYTTMVLWGDCPLPLPIIEDDLQDDHGALIGPPVMNTITLAVTISMPFSLNWWFIWILMLCLSERNYLKYLVDLAASINQPQLPKLIVKCGKIVEVTLGTLDIKSGPMRCWKGLWLQLMCCTSFRLLSQDFGTRMTEYQRSEYWNKGQSCSQSRTLEDKLSRWELIQYSNWSIYMTCPRYLC